MSPTFHAVTGDLIVAAAQALAGNEHARLPDLTALTVLLPNLSCARRFSAALFAASDAPVILLPKISTLAKLAAGAPCAMPVYPTQQRVSDVYQALRERQWLAAEDLWSLAYEVVAIVDEMNAAGHGLPATPQALLAQIHAVYRAGHDKPLEFESKLLFELWYVLSQKRGSLDTTAVRHLALASIAMAASAPLYVVGLAQLSRREERFLHAYAEHAPVHIFESNDRDYRLSAAPRSIYVAAWAPYKTEPPATQEAIERVDALRASAVEPITNLTLLPAHSLDHEAANLARVVRHWLAGGRQSVGIIALDRLLARRLRALLERDRIIVDDEAGWALSTTRAAALVMGLARANQPQASEQLAFLKSALTFSGHLGELERLALARLEQALFKTRTPVARVEDFAARFAPHLLAQVQKLGLALRRIGHKPRPLALWIAALDDAIDIFELKPALQADRAGLACLNLLESLRREGAEDGNVFAKSEWLQWLDRELEMAAFREPIQAAKVTFTHLEASRLRRFDCVAFAGADDKHLPGKAGAHAFFNEGVRRELGLAHHASQLCAVESLLIALCSESTEVVVSWQQTLDGEPNIASRYFSRLDNFHQRLFDAALPMVELPIGEGIQDLGCVLPLAPAPSVTPALIPQRMSASASNSLIACPYQYYAKYVLRLGELEEDEDIGKRDYGSLVHRILHDFHTAHPMLIEIDEQAACAALTQVSLEVFRDELARDFVAQAWLLKWRAKIPAYVTWQRERELAGWRWYAGEVSAQTQLNLPDGQAVILNGRIDRIDVRYENGVAGYAIFDYKSQKVKPLNDKLADPGEDVQLPFYALLRPDATEIAYVALDGDTVEQVAPKQPIAELAAAVTVRLQHLIEAIARGASLPAHGDSKSCGFCNVRVVCRRDYW